MNKADIQYKTIKELIDADYPNAMLESGNIEAEIINGYKVETTEVLRTPYGAREQRVKIYPFVKWTDGAYKPCYGGGWECCKDNVTLYMLA